MVKKIRIKLLQVKEQIVSLIKKYNKAVSSFSVWIQEIVEDPSDIVKKIFEILLSTGKREDTDTKELIITIGMVLDVFLDRE